MTAHTRPRRSTLTAGQLDTLAGDLAPFRGLAADWHGGQRSPLYALASTGAVPDPVGLLRELQGCILAAGAVTAPDDAARDAPYLVRAACIVSAALNLPA